MNCRAAASISPVVAAVSGRRRVLMLRHMQVRYPDFAGFSSSPLASGPRRRLVNPRRAPESRWRRGTDVLVQVEDVVRVVLGLDHSEPVIDPCAEGGPDLVGLRVLDGIHVRTARRER